MKRLLSWLLALVMIISCLPLSALPAFAVENDVETEDGNDNFVAEFDELTKGMESNPIDLTADFADSTATVTVPAGKTIYYTARIGGMIMSINGDEGKLMAGDKFKWPVFSITNEGAEDAEYVITVAQPVGTMENPATLVLGENVATVAAGAQGYFYTYTAEQAGTLVLEIATNAAGWTYAVNNLTTYAYGDTQWSDSDPVVNPYEVEVAAGDKLEIMVCTYDATNPWSAPAGTVTVNASYKAEEPAPEYIVTASGITLDMASELFIQSKFLIPDELYADENATVTIEFKGDVTEYNLVELKNELGLDSKGRLAIKQPIPAPYMDKMLTITIADGNGNLADFTSGGVNYEGSYSYGIETYADAICNVASMKNVMDAIAALLTYGSVAQEMFSNLPNVSTEPASNLLSKYGYEPVDLTQFSVADATQSLVNSGADFGVSLRGGTPALDAAVYMTVQFNYDKSVALENLSFVVKYHEAASNKDYEIPVEATLNSKGRIEIKIENIAAALFDCIYTVEVTNTLTGEVYNGQYSVYEYIRATVTALDGNASQATTVNMAKAMYFYNQAANTLFE